MAKRKMVDNTPQPIIGRITDCKSVNIRKGPSLDAEVVCIKVAGAELLIDPSKSTRDFYSVCTAAGIEGYCYKPFITII